MKECIVILGMHRSGTSVISGLISLQGFDLGVSEMPLREDNPKGFFENHAIYRFNQNILEEYNTSWDNYSFTFNQIKPGDLKRYELKAKEILKKEFGIARHIFIKDPRMCLLFPLWETVLKELGFNIKVVFVYRSPMEVALSLQSRNDFVLKKSVLMWSHYCFQAERNSRSYERKVVHYAHDLEDLDVFVKGLSEFLNIELNQDLYQSAHELYTPKLKHHHVDLEVLSDDMPAYFKDFIVVLKNGKLNQAKKLDTIIDEFYLSQDLFLYDDDLLRQKVKLLEDEKKKLHKLQSETALSLENFKLDANSKYEELQNQLKLQLEKSEEKAKLKLEASEEKAKFQLEESERRSKLQLEESERRSKLQLEESEEKG